MPCTKADNRT
jgi:26S proteasome regulatory subunit N10